MGPEVQPRAPKALADSDPEDAEALEETLATAADPAKSLAGLVSDPPGWLKKASHRTWRFVAEAADGFGLWESAEQAFLTASEIAGADRAAMLAQAAMSAEFANAHDRYDQHLHRARELDADSYEVLRAELLAVSDPSLRLDRLADVAEPHDDRHAATLDAIRAYALIELGRIDEAEECIRRAADRYPDSLSLRELRPLAVLHRNRMRVASGKAPQTTALRQAAGDYLSLRNDLVESGRFRESGRLLACAVEATALAGELRHANELSTPAYGTKSERMRLHRSILRKQRSSLDGPMSFSRSSRRIRAKRRRDSCGPRGCLYRVRARKWLRRSRR